MDSKANVRDIDSLMRAKALFAKARTELLQAVSEAVSHAESIDAWVERDGPLRWESERRRAAEALAAAKSALYRKEMTPAIVAAVQLLTKSCNGSRTLISGLSDLRHSLPVRLKEVWQEMQQPQHRPLHSRRPGTSTELRSMDLPISRSRQIPRMP